MSKKILGLDLGTNSIGWCLIDQDFENNSGKIEGMGSRIIPMSQDILSEFGKGNSVSQTAERTRYRSARRLHERQLLRRERLHRVLNILGFLPKHYANDIDFESRLGKFKNEAEPKLAWFKNAENKFEFLFQTAFSEMLSDFRKNQPELLNRKNRKGEDVKVPYDWTIYYLRKKALTEKISKEELGWLILNFNQKRGYYQLRGEVEENNTDVNEYVMLLKAVKVEKGEVDKKNDKRTWYSITFDNSWVYNATFTSEPKWLDTEKEFLITEELDESGNIKIVKDKKSDTHGKEKRKITPLPSFDEIDLMSKKDQDKIYKKIKARTELSIQNSDKTVGAFIYDTLLKSPSQKIRGKLIRTIERNFYKDELKAILKAQITLQPELFTSDLYNDCVRELYKNNESHQMQLFIRDFLHLFLDDIIFYQRPLRSQKSTIGNCPLESRPLRNEKGQPKLDSNGNQIWKLFKVIPKSNPYYQEFRVWKWLSDLRIWSIEDGNDVTAKFLGEAGAYDKLFDFLMSKKEVNHLDILDFFIRPVIKDNYPNAKPKILNEEIKREIAKYRWNYVFDEDKNESKEYPCNETGFEISRRFEKVNNVPTGFLTKEIEYKLWHIIYSVTDKNEFKQSLKSFAKKYKLDELSFVENFIKFPPFTSDFGPYSEKAIKKLLPLLRSGKYWEWGLIDTKSRERIGKLITGEFDEDIKIRVREKVINKKLETEKDFQALPEWLAKYIVYNRHSEADIAGKWNSVSDLKAYLNDFKQHSLRNPIVEQVITETLRVVGDIWTHYGSGRKDFFDEIHIELGREMKNTAEERKRITSTVVDNENTNQRIKLLLMELNNDKAIEEVRPYSPSQLELLKIYEDGILSNYSEQDLKNEKTGLKKENKEITIYDISKTAKPTQTELIRYKLWLEQKYRSPYTGEVIPLSKLFTTAYEIEHIIPQSRYFDDSFSNKVICEAAVNRLKNNQLGLEFIKNHYGERIQIGSKYVTIFTEEAYKKFADDHYAKNKAKRGKLLLEEIPDKMIARQMNDTRYISKFISQVLSNIVRKDNNDEGINSKNVIPCNGKITDRLKQDWGLNDVWNELILPRFQRMNELTKTTVFTATNKEGHTIPVIPFELSKGFQKKRIDHRHHALDALVIASATRNHINLLNNQSAKSDNTRFDLQYKLRNTEKWKDEAGNERIRFTEFKKPWPNFTIDAQEKLENVVVSFKQNLRVINKATNTYIKFENGKKVEKKQEGVNWAVRKPLHKAFVFGKTSLQWIKVPKGKICVAIRRSLTPSIDIYKITDTGIQKILKAHLLAKDNNSELAFSPEGIDELNKNILSYTGGKYHQPIYKVRTFEIGSRFPLGQIANKKNKYVETADGTNLFFAIYWNTQKQIRNFETIPLNIVIERLKQGLSPVPEINGKGDSLLFYLSPNDLVYVPTEDELADSLSIDFEKFTNENRGRFYNVNDFSSTCYFTPNSIAKAIAPKEVDLEFDENKNKLTGSFDTKTASLNQRQIKDVCIKLNIDRLGNISPVKKKPGSSSTTQQHMLAEPGQRYKKGSLKIFSSFEAAEEANAEAMALLSPEQHLQNVTSRIMTIYEAEMKMPMNKKIKFRN
ncbi:MAG TPA: HNH endonuclease domain-containing protein [Ferruginibacter sp.]|nr:HNH endonuclease domain-containing protein [Ferruginibacter sp.]HMP21559.1 HNH endonuclease domain-containing protein [Ferruginibacter sp.]